MLKLWHPTIKTMMPAYFWMMKKYWDVIGWRWEASDQSFFSIWVTSRVISVTLIIMGRGEESKEREGEGEGNEGEVSGKWRRREWQRGEEIRRERKGRGRGEEEGARKKNEKKKKTHTEKVETEQGKKGVWGGGDIQSAILQIMSSQKKNYSWWCLLTYSDAWTVQYTAGFQAKQLPCRVAKLPAYGLCLTDSCHHTPGPHREGDTMATRHPALCRMKQGNMAP